MPTSQSDYATHKPNRERPAQTHGPTRPRLTPARTVVVARHRRPGTSRAVPDCGSRPRSRVRLCDPSPVEVLITLSLFTVTVLAVAWLADRAAWSAPLLLILVGVLGSVLPFVQAPQLPPDLVLVGVLPPLLYAAAVNTSLADFRDNIGAIGWLSVGLVALTAVVVGVVVWLILGIPFAAAGAIGAVVSPPDAVAATAVARQVGLPRRVVTILEGESLVNDATALVGLRTALLG